MERLKELLQVSLNTDFIGAVISNPRKKGGVKKIKIRPVQKDGRVYFQFEAFTEKQAFHENLRAEEACEKMISYMEEFRQMQMKTRAADISVLVSKKGKVTVQEKKRKQMLPPADLSHNRKKKYIINEGEPVPFLIDLGVMTSEGRLIHSRTDKFRQINRFLEFIEDILPALSREKEVTILDFGCGKSYLTFAVYYYLHELKGYDIRIIGLDLKEDVIRRCSELSEKYGYKKLHFLTGDIAEYDGVEQVDMVITLHACDTATDYALAKAVGWGAKVILSVPCCQHEVNAQLTASAAEELQPVLDYGLLKERFAALVTDGLRAKYLEAQGYETQVLEFIDMEHTPKNILIRAEKKNKRNEKYLKEIKKCTEYLKIEPTLGKLFSEKGENSNS